MIKNEVLEFVRNKINKKQNIDYSIFFEDLTLLTTCYNRGQMLKSDLVNGFKLGNQKKLIVDDCSTKEQEIISYLERNKEYYNIYKIIKHKENKGTAGARQSGFENIVTKYTMILDDDDMIFCIDKEKVSKKIERLSNDGIMVIPRYIINLYNDGSLNIGYDRMKYNENYAKDVLLDYLSTGEILAFLAGSIIKNSDLTKYNPVDKFRAAEDYIMFTRMFSNNLSKRILVTEELIHVRRIDENSLSKSIGTTGYTLHLISHLVSGYYCLINNLIDFNEMINLFSKRAILIEKIYGFGEEFSKILIDFIMNKAAEEDIIEYLRKQNIYCEDSLDELAIEINKMRGLNNYRRKIVFFVVPQGDSFINDIIEDLSEKCEVRKIIVTDFNQIVNGMNWADICWFEWCDELIIYGSKLQIAKKKTIICRLHSYEAFTNNIMKVNWEVVDNIIFVAEHIKNLVVSKVKIDNDKISVIPNGLNLNKYKFKNYSKGFNISFIGYIDFKKGPMLLIHTFKAIHDIDNRYKLYIAGQFKEERYKLYFNQMIEEMELKESIFFQGWQTDIDKWLEDKEYIICTSVLESQNMSIMQAMSKGIKPIIHNFVGAKQIYSEKYIWNTIEDAVKMIISDEYNSREYREFVENKYSLKKQIEVMGEKIFNNF